MKTKQQLITLSLCGALCILPCHKQRARAAEPQWIQVACGLLVIGAGIYITIELYKYCKKNLQQEPEKPKDPPATNNVNQAQAVMAPGTLRLTDSNVTTYDVSAYGMSDPVTGSLILNHAKGVLQSSPDLASWSEAFSFEAWASTDGIMFLWTKAGSPVLTNYCAMGATNAVPLPLLDSAPAKFYRLTTP